MAHTCNLIIKDEVNIKFEGLDISTRRKLSNAVKYFLPHARHLPAYKLGRWDGCIRFCDIGGRSYLNCLEKLLPVLESSGYEIQVQDLRPTFTPSYQPITVDHFSDRVWPEGHPAAGEPILLRDYQVEVINKFLENPQSLQQVATGSGKTIMTAALSNLVEPMGRSVVIVPNKDLVTQTEKDYKNLGLDVGVYFGDRKETGKTHTICTWQSLDVLRKNTRAGRADYTIDDFAKDVVCVIVDETHKAKSDVLRDLLSTVFSTVPIRWGLTGTVPREEHEYMSCVCALGPVVNSLSSRELQDMGVLAEISITVMQMRDPPMQFRSYAEELKWLTTNSDRIDAFSELVSNISESGNTLVLVDRLETGRMLVERFPEWTFVSGDMKSADRGEQYDEINTGDNKVVVATYGVAAVGINIPRIFNLVLFESGKSFVRVIQSIGRSIRKAKDKDFAAVYDVCGTLKYSKKHLATRKKYYKEQQFHYTMKPVDY